jgi:hypothetical protein
MPDNDRSELSPAPRSLVVLRGLAALVAGVYTGGDGNQVLLQRFTVTAP